MFAYIVLKNVKQHRSLATSVEQGSVSLSSTLTVSDGTQLTPCEQISLAINFRDEFILHE